MSHVQIIQRRCQKCGGSGLVMKGRFARKCPECGGFFPWQVGSSLGSPLRWSSDVWQWQTQPLLCTAGAQHSHHYSQIAACGCARGLLLRLYCSHSRAGLEAVFHIHSAAREWRPLEAAAWAD